MTAPKVESINTIRGIGDHGNNGSLSSVVTLTPPNGASQILMQALTQNIRFRLDNGTPTASVGFQLKAGDPPLLIWVGGNDIKIIEETASANVQYQWVQ